MTEEMKKEIKNLSKKYLETVDAINRQKNAKQEFDEALKEKVEEDFLNKKLFLKYNSELTGLTLEFRNIFGIEGGLYEEKYYPNGTGDPGSPFVYPEGTEKSDMYDSHLLVDSCGSISDLGQMGFPDNSPFYVDKYRDQEGSPYYMPFCPPNLSVWCANKYYKGHTRRFYKIEHVMVEYIKGLNSSALTSFPSNSPDGILTYQFDYEHPVEFYSNKDGFIQKEVYKIEADPNSLPPPPGGGFYTPTSVEIINGKEEVGYGFSFFVPSPPDPEKVYDLNKGDFISFKLTAANGISHNEIGYAYVYKKDGNKIYLDLLHYDGNVISKPTTYTIRKLWKFWKKEQKTNPQKFSLIFMKGLVKDPSALKQALNTYERVYIDSVLHYLNRIDLPDNNTKISIEKMRTVKEAFNTYRKNGSIAPLINAIEDRRFWLYRKWVSANWTDSKGNYSIRAQQIHDYMRDSDIFDKVYGTINNRINKRTGTLRELLKYAFNTTVADGILELKKENITSYGDTLVVFPLVSDTNGTEFIEIKLEEDETIDSFYEYIKWMSEIYIVSDNDSIPFFKTRVIDIEERGKEAISLTLSEKIPIETVYRTSDNARIIRIF